MPLQQQQQGRQLTPEEQALETSRQQSAELQRQIDLMRQQEQARREQTAQITETLPRVQLERLGTAEEQAQRAQLAKELMAQQQAGQRQLLAQQAKQGIRGGAAAAQQSRLQQQIAAQRASQEEQGFLGRRQFNIGQAQREQFANVASELARRQLMTALRGQELQAQAAREFGQQQVQVAQSGGGGTLICTELYRQGLMSKNIYELDEKFGRAMRINRPDIVIGYWTLAKPVVKLMQKSKWFTNAVYAVASPWAKHMAHCVDKTLPNSFVGSVIMWAGSIVCGLVGFARVKVKAYGAN